MSIAQQVKIAELERRIAALELLTKPFVGRSVQELTADVAKTKPATLTLPEKRKPNG